MHGGHPDFNERKKSPALGRYGPNINEASSRSPFADDGDVADAGGGTLQAPNRNLATFIGYPETANPKLETRNLKLGTRHPKPET